LRLAAGGIKSPVVRPYFAFSRADRDDIGPAAGSTDDAACGSVSYRSGITSRLRHPCVLARASRVVKPREADKLLLVTGTRTYRCAE